MERIGLTYPFFYPKMASLDGVIQRRGRYDKPLTSVYGRFVTGKP